MKQIWPNYSYSPATNVLTLTGLNIDRDQLLLVAAPERGRIMYNFADSAVTASAYTAGANTALTLVASTAGLTTTASLVIYYDDQLQSTSVSISNLPATQPVSIASVTIGNTVTIAGTVTANPTGTQTIAGTVTANVFVQSAFGLGEDIAAGMTEAGGIPISGTVTIGSALPAGTNRIGVVTIGAGTVTIGAGISQIGSVTASISGTVPISISSVTVGNSVTIGSLPAISGTVTASNLTSALGVYAGGNSDISVNIKSVGGQSFGQGQTWVPVAIAEGSLLAGTNRIGVVTIGAGTVTIGAGTAEIGTVKPAKSQSGNAQFLSVDDGSGKLFTSTLLTAGTAQIGSVTASISGTVPISISSVTVGNSVTIGSLPAISGTVTANSSNGSLTTRFGSVTTANTAFATSAVTNANRKYLLIQNVTTASNVITVGVGFTPTTTQGIQLTAGAGLTFEGNYIPTGAVNLLSSVTASCFTILEA